MGYMFYEIISLVVNNITKSRLLSDTITQKYFCLFFWLSNQMPRSVFQLRGLNLGLKIQDKISMLVMRAISLKLFVVVQLVSLKLPDVQNCLHIIVLNENILHIFFNSTSLIETYDEPARKIEILLDKIDLLDVWLCHYKN